MTIEINDKYLNGLDVEEIKKEFISFLQSKTKKKSIEERIKSNKNLNTQKAQKVKELFSNFKDFPRNLDINTIKDEYFREKGYL